MSKLRVPLHALGALAAGLPLALGCAYSYQSRDTDRRPTVDTGAGATILYPGQSAPMPGTQPAGAGAGPEGGPAVPGASGPAGGGGSVTFIGGGDQEIENHLEVRESPIYHKYLTAPFFVLAAPFALAAEKLRGEPEPGPEIPERAHAQRTAPPPPPPIDYETQRLQAMERELEQRGAAAGAQAAVATRPLGGGSLSIADELAALQRAPGSGPPAPSPLPAVASAPVPSPPADAYADADGIVDRDQDGRIDQWIYRQKGQIVRKLQDNDGDGQPDRFLHYDPSTHRIARVDEDTNRDGALDSWTEYREGEVVRRRADANGDGQVDAWSYFRNDALARHESDTTGDGFRDRVRFYDAGLLTREEQDNDGDGDVEVELRFDAQERVERRAEDTNGDGRIDTISHYREGRLERRELLDASLDAPTGP